MKTPAILCFSFFPLLVFFAGSGCTVDATRMHRSWANSSHNGEQINVTLNEWRESEGHLPHMAGTWSDNRESRSYPVQGSPSLRIEFSFDENGEHTSSRSIVLYDDSFAIPRTGAEDETVIHQTDSYTVHLNPPEGDDREGSARLRFDTAYLEALAMIVPFEMSRANLQALVFTPVPLEFAQEVSANIEGVELEDLIGLRRSGVSSLFIRDLATAGYQFDVEAIVRLRRAGVSSSYAAELNEGGWRLDADQIVQLRRSGVSTTFANDIKDVYEEMDSDGVIRLRRSGVSSSYAEELIHGGYHFGVDDLISLRRAGVSAQFATEVRQAGYELSAEDLIRLRRAGVSATYLASLQSEGLPPYPVSSIIEFRRRGLSPETIRLIREQ